jgi:hypothetical protein
MYKNYYKIYTYFTRLLTDSLPTAILRPPGKSTRSKKGLPHQLQPPLQPHISYTAIPSYNSQPTMHRQ